MKTAAFEICHSERMSCRALSAVAADPALIFL